SSATVTPTARTPCATPRRSWRGSPARRSTARTSTPRRAAAHGPAAARRSGDLTPCLGYPWDRPMLLTRDEMTFDFAGARLEPGRDRELLEWMFNQFLYGEVTGIQVGHWLYDAPDFEAAKFLARQSLEEMQHVDNFLRIMAMLGCRPTPAHPSLRS